jgi:hypothetical protein
VAALPVTVGRKATRRHQVNRRRAAAVHRNRVDLAKPDGSHAKTVAGPARNENEAPKGRADKAGACRPSSLRCPGDEMGAARSISESSETAGPRSAMRENEAPGAAGVEMACLHLAGYPTQQPRPSRGENRIALGQFRSQRHLLLQSSGTLRLRDSLGNRKPRTVMLHLGDAHGIASTSGRLR